MVRHRPAGEVFVAVEQAGGTVEGVSRVVDGGTLFGRFVGGAEEDPLVGSRHLRARVRMAFVLQFHCQTIQFHAELSAGSKKRVNVVRKNCTSYCFWEHT